jgi:hypothetical protein
MFMLKLQRDHGIVVLLRLLSLSYSGVRRVEECGAVAAVTGLAWCLLLIIYWIENTDLAVDVVMLPVPQADCLVPMQDQGAALALRLATHALALHLLGALCIGYCSAHC